MKNLLEIHNLSIGYQGAEPALAGVNLQLGHQEILGVVGESGSGKTTLIRALINLLPAGGAFLSGSICFNGRGLSDLDHTGWHHIRGNSIAMIFQNPGSYLNPIVTVGRQFVESIRNHKDVTSGEAKDKAIETLDRMRLKYPDKIMAAYPFQLSGGMKQRVAIAMAMAMEPLLLLADEPTSALDVKTQAKIIHELLELRQNYNTSIIMVTHNICCAAHIADKLLVMRQGRVIECGATSEVLMAPEKGYTRKLLASIPNLKIVEKTQSCDTCADRWTPNNIPAPLYGT